MSNYYVIKGGQRYDAALIKSAQARIRGAGDGRISKQDALELWLIAMDGARLTEVEEATFAYLQDTLNWTAPAKEWLETAIATEVEKTKSFFKQIAGLRYDRKLLEAAERVTSSKEGKQISFEEAQLLFPIINDAGGLSIGEERSLEYLFENYDWTEKAENWILDKIWFFEKGNPYYKGTNTVLFLVQHTLARFPRHQGWRINYLNFSNFEFAYFKSEARQQMLAFNNKVVMHVALMKAINSLLDDTDEKSFKSVFNYVSEPMPEFLEQTRLVLLPGDMASEPALNSFPSPSRGESIRDNWIFGLDLFDLSDDIFWIIVPRDGEKPAYNYIGGANVGDIYHIEETEQYFTILLSSGDTPAADVMVEVQDPRGKFILTKSNEQGKVLITGPLGEYVIYLPGGRDDQSNKLDWDGNGTDTVWYFVMDS